MKRWSPRGHCSDVGPVGETDVVKKLYQFQVEGAKWLAPRRQALLGDQPGCGKTPTTLVALPRNAPVVIVCKASATENWADEAACWRRDYRVLVVRTQKDFRWPKPGEIVIMSFGVMPPSEREIGNLRARVVAFGTSPEKAKAVAALQARVARAERARKRLRPPMPNTIIVPDEAHRLGNPTSRRTMRFREMAALVWRSGPWSRIWPLTGSPLVNKKLELWTVLQCAGLGKLAFGSREAYDAAWSELGAVPAALQTVMLRRMRAQILPELPKETHKRVIVEIDPESRAQLDELVKRLRARGVNLESMTLEAIRRAAADAQLSQFVSLTRERLAVAKIPAVLDYVVDAEEEENKLVVYSGHLRPLVLLGRRRGWGHILGDDSNTDRKKTIDAFQAGKLRGVAVSEAGGESVTLTRAWNMLLIDVPWNPAGLGQVTGRISRIRAGMPAVNGLLFQRFVANHPFEIRMDEILEEKQTLIDQSVDAAAVLGTPVTS